MSQERDEQENDKKFYNNYIDDSTKSKLEIFYNNTQEALENGFDTAFKNLETALITTINTAFTAFETERERRLELNREAHEKAMSGLTSELQTTNNFFKGGKNKKKAQGISLVNNFQDILNKRKKAFIFFKIKKYYLDKKNRRQKALMLENYLKRQKKFLIFNSWRNITNSFAKNKLRMINNKNFLERSQKITQESEEEINKLKAVLESIQIDIQKEINERKNLSKLYDLSLKKGVEAFLRETNYVVDIDSSNIQTPNERSFVEEEKKYFVDIKAKTK